MPWINKASLALYIARITVTRGWPARRLQQRDQPEIRKEYCAVEFVSVIEASRLVTIKVESRCHLHDFWGQHRSMCTHSIDDLLPHAPLHCAATGEMVKCSLLYKTLIPIAVTCHNCPVISIALLPKHVMHCFLTELAIILNPKQSIKLVLYYTLEKHVQHLMIM